MRVLSARWTTSLLCAALFVGSGNAPSGAELLASSVYGPFPASYASNAGQNASRPELGEADRVAREVIRTNRFLASVEPKVNRTGNDKAKDDLATAVTRQVEARQAISESQYARAMRLTLEARAYAKSAAAKVGPLEDDPDAVGRALDQTDDALARARELIDDSGDPRSKRSHEALEAKQKGARVLLNEGKTRRAFAETRQVRDGVLQFLRGADLPVSEDVARKALKRAERATERAEEDLGARPTAEAKRYEREAKAQLQKARVAHARRNYRETLLYAKLVERNLELAVAAHRLALNRNG